MSSIYESSLVREVIRLEQELVSFKTKQIYRTGQSKGFVSNTLRVDSQIAFTRDGYEWREVYVELKLIGDHADKIIAPVLRTQLYSSSGAPIYYGAGYGNDSVNLLTRAEKAESANNEYSFLVNFYIVKATGTTDAFYAHFWCVANDSGILTLTTRHTTS